MKRSTVERIRETLENVLPYLEDRADADHDGVRYVPNEAMSLQREVEEALELLEVAERERTEREAVSKSEGGCAHVTHPADACPNRA